MKRFVEQTRHKHSEELSQINALLSRTTANVEQNFNKYMENGENMNPSKARQNLIEIFKNKNRNSKPACHKDKRPPSLKPEDLSRTLSTYSSCP